MSTHILDALGAPLLSGRVGRWLISEPGIEGKGQPRAEHMAIDPQIRYSWGPGGPRHIEFLGYTPNQSQYGWGAIAAQCMGRGNRNYRISSLYIEFENVADPDDEVDVPTYERNEGLEYYTGLSVSSSRDFLRVPLMLDPTISIKAGYEDAFTEGLTGNVLTFYSQTQGTSGHHGKTFSAGANSKVFGVALVATPVFSDPTQDLIFARAYFTGDDQTVKQQSSQVGLTWDVSFL